jgi:hypothetical protein
MKQLQLPLPQLPVEGEAPSLRDELARAGILSGGEAVPSRSSSWRLGKRSQHLAVPLLHDPRVPTALAPNKAHAGPPEVY